MGGCRKVNETTYGSGELVLFSDSEIYKLIVDGIRNELQKQKMNACNMKNQELRDTLENIF